MMMHHSYAMVWLKRNDRNSSIQLKTKQDLYHAAYKRSAHGYADDNVHVHSDCLRPLFNNMNIHYNLIVMFCPFVFQNLTIFLDTVQLFSSSRQDLLNLIISLHVLNSPNL